MKNILIVGNKHDLERAVTKNEIDLWCRDFEMEFIETSVFADKGIDVLINRTIERCLEQEKAIQALQDGELHNSSGAVSSGKDPLNTFQLNAGVEDIKAMEIKEKRKKGCC